MASCDRFKVIDPTVVDIDRMQLETTYMWNQDMLEMWDECYELAVANPRIDLTGDLPDNLNTIVGNLGNGIIRSENPSTWAQLKEQNREAFEYYIDELNAMVADYVTDGTTIE